MGVGSSGGSGAGFAQTGSAVTPAFAIRLRVYDTTA